jgi:SAM-dependent methyltransferase
MAMADESLGMSYLEIQAYMGTTKHMGGQQTTEELAARTHIDAQSTVLDVGCGVGATPCYLAQVYGCRVMGVDLQPAMIAHAEDRVRREGVGALVDLRVADAQDLPFADAHYDVAFCESVASFVEDKARVVAELARVTRPGGYVGLNEVVWLQPPVPEMIEGARRLWGLETDVLAADGWLALLADAGLQEASVQTYALDPRRESSQLRRYHFSDMWGMFYRTLRLYLTSVPFRAYMRARRSLPKGIFTYLGYAVIVARVR